MFHVQSSIELLYAINPIFISEIILLLIFLTINDYITAGRVLIELSV